MHVMGEFAFDVQSTVLEATHTQGFFFRHFFGMDKQPLAENFI